MPRLPQLPQVQWTDGGVPHASAFDDVYFSRQGGLAEAEAVFLEGCGLPASWRNTAKFAICELGFGTGLNVLAAWRAWKKTRSPHAILHISSIEAYPVARDDAARALANFPEVVDLAAKLLECWPVRAYAPQRFWFPEDRFVLTLHIGEAESVLAGLQGSFDAWFLDGFAPARNPEMWSGKIFQQIARLSAPGARLATFTVAGGVRRELERVGFAVEKKPGFGSKRERLEARCGRVDADARECAPPKRVAILGAGIAGAATAQALVRRDVETIVLDEAPAPAAGASGNPAGLIMPRLDRGGGGLSEMFLAAYLHAVHEYEALGEGVFLRCGIEERPRSGSLSAFTDLLADPPLPEDWLAPLPSGAAMHLRAGLVRPGAAVTAMLRGSALICETRVTALERAGEGWILRAEDGRALLKADAVVLACGAAMAQFEPVRFLPIQLSRGQIEWGALTGEPLRQAITQGSYAAPYEGGVLFGATFDKCAPDYAPIADVKSRQRNLEALAVLAPDLASRVDKASLQSRAAVRATTADRTPIAGALPDVATWTPARPVQHAGMFVLGGLGARGLTLAPLLAEIIASQICDEPQMLSVSALEAVDPARFLRRRARRQD